MSAPDGTVPHLVLIYSAMLEDPDLSNDRSVKRKSKPNFSFRKKCTAINYSFTKLHGIYLFIKFYNLQNYEKKF